MSDDRRPAAEAGRADDDGGDEEREYVPTVRERIADAISNRHFNTPVVGIGGARRLSVAIDVMTVVQPILDELAEARAQLAEVTRERDEARAKAVDGGGWQWGVRWEYDIDKPIDWSTSWDEERARRYVAMQPPGKATLTRRRIGPVEPVTDDGSGT